MKRDPRPTDLKRRPTGLKTKTHRSRPTTDVKRRLTDLAQRPTDLKRRSSDLKRRFQVQDADCRDNINELTMTLHRCIIYMISKYMITFNERAFLHDINVKLY